MTPRTDAQRFLDQLRAMNRAALGTAPTRPEPAIGKDLVERFLRDSLIPEQGQDPHMRAMVEQAVAGATQNLDDALSEMLATMQDHIETTAAARIDGADLGRLRPLVGHLQTGQLNAVSMRVPGRSGGYLVLFEDQLPLFASKLSKAVAWAIPRKPADEDGMSTFTFGVDEVIARIEAAPEVADRFADIVLTYAVTGGLEEAGNHLVPPGYLNLAAMLRDGLEYFVLGHEYAHILLGHLDTTGTRTGVLPATEAEALAYSWSDELDADWLGMVLSVNAGVEHAGLDIFASFMGISLFFDALDVMDRAVALLQTGDEHARQLGSHPPADLRKQRLRDFLPRLIGSNNAANAPRVQTALELAEVQSLIIRLLWERTRPHLVDLRRRGVPAAHTWRTIPKETGDEPQPPPSAPAPKQVRRGGWRWSRSG